MAWKAEYKRKLTTADTAVCAVESDMRVYVHANAAFPPVLLEALTRRSGQLRNVEMMHLLGFGEAYYNRPEFAESFRHNALFIGSNMRQAVEEGRADYIPVHLSEIEDLFRGKEVELDVALLHVSTPDRHGYCSLGVAVETTLTAARCARSGLHRSTTRCRAPLATTFMHVNEFDAIVECSHPLPELIPGAGDRGASADCASRCGADQRRSMLCKSASA